MKRCPSLQLLVPIVLLSIVPQASAQRPSAGARDLFFRAQEARNRQQWEQATDYYRQVLKLRQAGRYAEESLFWIAYCQQQLERYDKALEAYSNYLKRYPNGKYVALVEAHLRRIASALEKEVEVDPSVTELLARAQTRARQSAIMALTGNVSYQDVPLVLELLDREKDPSLRAVLITSLGRVQDPDLVPRLEAIVFQDSSLRTRVAAIQALSRIKDPSAALSLARIARRVSDPQVLRAVLPALVRVDEQIAAPILLSVARSGADPQLQALAISSLARVGSSPAYIDSLYEIALASTNSPPKFHEAVLALSRMSADGRSEGFWTIARLRPLVEIALQDTSGMAIAPLVGLLASVDKELWDQLSPRLFQALASASNPKMAQNVLMVFQKQGFGKVRITQFLGLLRNPDLDPWVAARILRLLQSRSANPGDATRGLRVLIQTHRPALDLTTAISGIRPELSLPVLEEELKSADPGWRAMVAEALGHIASRTPKAVTDLIHLAESDPDPTVRQKALEQLARIHAPAAQQAVRRLVDELYK